MTLPPLVITTPGLDGLPYGPGFDVVGGMGSGPLPTEQYWEHIISSSAGGTETEHVTTLTSRTLSFNETSYVQGSTVLVPNVTSAIPHGATGTLTIRLRTSSQILEQTSRPIVIDWQSGYQHLIALRQSTATSGGFAEADRVQLAQVKALSAFNLGAWLPELAAALEAAAQFPYGAELIGDRQGAGVLTRPGGGFNVNAFGIKFEIVAGWPPGYGIDEGNPDFFHDQVLELNLTGQVTGGDITITDNQWFHGPNGSWVWNLNIPYQVLYWISPGITVRFWWLLFNPLTGVLLGPAQLLKPFPS